MLKSHSRRTKKVGFCSCVLIIANIFFPLIRVLGINMVRMAFFSGFLIISTTSCVSTEVESQTALCSGLLEFASSAQPNESKVVKLVNDWGNWKKACSYYEDPAGQRFCEVLMPNTSTEFMKLNLQSLLKCIDASLETRNVYVSELDGDVTVFEIAGLYPDIELNFRFSIGSNDEDDFIEIKSSNVPFE